MSAFAWHGPAYCEGPPNCPDCDATCIERDYQHSHAGVRSEGSYGKIVDVTLRDLYREHGAVRRTTGGGWEPALNINEIRRAFGYEQMLGAGMA